MRVLFVLLVVVLMSLTSIKSIAQSREEIAGKIVQADKDVRAYQAAKANGSTTGWGQESDGRVSGWIAIPLIAGVAWLFVWRPISAMKEKSDLRKREALRETLPKMHPDSPFRAAFDKYLADAHKQLEAAKLTNPNAHIAALEQQLLEIQESVMPGGEHENDPLHALMRRLGIWKNELDENSSAGVDSPH